MLKLKTNGGDDKRTNIPTAGSVLDGGLDVNVQLVHRAFSAEIHEHLTTVSIAVAIPIASFTSVKLHKYAHHRKIH